MKFSRIKILFFILSLMLLIIIQPSPLVDNKQETLPYTLKSSQIGDSYSGIGGPQNVTEYGEGIFINANINLSQNEDASIIVPDGWKAEQIQFDITDLYEYDKKWIDDKFDIGYDSNYWSTETQSDNVTFGWYDAPSGTNDSIYIRFEESGSTIGKKAFWNYTFNLPREQVPFEDWVISFNYRVLFSDPLWLAGSGGASNHFEIDVNGITQSFDQLKLDALNNNTWYQDNIVPFKAEPYNFNLPGTISLIFGIDYKNYDQSPTGNFEIYYDNITLQLSTLPKPSQIGLNITDITNGQETAVIDGIDPIVGTVNLYNTWIGSTGGTNHYFSFNHNSSGDIILNSDFHSKAISLKKTETMLGLEGTEFSVDNNSLTTWTYYFPVSIPGSYSTNYYFNISKPTNWNVTHLYDPYGGERISDILTTAGIGSSTLVIPKNIISNGIWKIVAGSPNYVNQAKLYKKVDSSWYENSSFQEYDQLKVNATINTSLIPNIDNTNASLKLFYPNGTLWYQISENVDITGLAEFPEITLGPQNTTIGEYTVYVSWSDNDNNMTQVGLKILNFEVFHKSSLQRSNYHDSQRIRAFSGDFLVFKVNYTDLYTGLPIDNAIVSFTIHNATPIFGDMVYQGGGIYFADLDTTGLQLGLYNITVSADKAYFEAQNDILLFELEIQLYTSLERISYPTFVQWNDNVTLSFLYKDSYDNGITGAQVTLSIPQEYIIDIDDFGNGYYDILFESAAFSPIGTHQITVNFTALNYDTKLDTIQFEIIAQDVNIEVSLNSNPLSESELKDLYFRENISITARAFASVDNDYLKGGTFTLLSDRYEENLTEIYDSVYSINLTLSGADFNSGINNIFIRFQKENYTTSIFSFQMYLRAQDINMSVYIDSLFIEQNSLEFRKFYDSINISCRAYATIEEIYLTGGNMTFVINEVEIPISEIGNSWYNSSILISPAYFLLGPNLVYVKFESFNYTTTAYSFQVFVNQLQFNVDTIGFEGVTEGYSGEYIENITVILTDEGTSNLITNATIAYFWDFGSGYFKVLGNGTYILERLNLPEIPGQFTFTLTISKDGSIYQSKVYEFIVQVTEPPPPPPPPNILPWIILFGSFIVIGVLGALSIRTYVIIPRKRKKEADLIAKTQAFKDLWNIQAVVLIQKESGLPIYAEEITIMEHEDDSFLISGFIQAISSFSETFIEREFKDYKDLAKGSEYSKAIINLDFKYFQLLVCDYKEVRMLIVLRDQPSERLKRQLYLLSVALNSQYGDKIKNFTGNISDIKDQLIFLLNQFLILHYNGTFEITGDRKYYNRLMESKELTKMERRIINVILSITQRENKFRLKELVKVMNVKNEDLVLEGLNSLIQRKLLVPTYIIGLNGSN